MDARKVVFNILKQVYEDGAYANIALNKYLSNNQVTDQQRRFITELVYGVVKMGDSLLWIAKKFSKKPLVKLDKAVVIILRMGIYQIKYMDAVPDSAACDESVKLAKSILNQGAGNFVNGILRTYIRDKAKGDFPTGNKAQEVAIREYHPLWLVKLFIKTFGSEQALDLCRFNNEKAPLNVRVNTCKIQPKELIKKLEALGCKVELSDKAPEGLVLVEHPSLTNLAPWQEGLMQIQDEASMMVAHVLAPEPGEKILDVCAAPGGKTTHLAEFMKGSGEILAGDIYEHKIRLIEDNAQRLGHKIIKAQTWDAMTLGEKWPNSMDRVLVDAPCSGMGVLRKKVDARWHKDEGIFKELPPLQLAILNSAAKTVKLGGVLVYSTCTIFKEENEDVVEKFLAVNKDFVLEDAYEYLPFKKKHKKGKKMINFFPTTDKTDGFFIARLKRVK